MRLYDFLYKYNLRYTDFITMIQEMREFIDFDVDEILDQVDKLYNDNEYKQFVKDCNKEQLMETILS